MAPWMPRWDDEPGWDAGKPPSRLTRLHLRKRVPPTEPSPLFFNGLSPAPPYHVQSCTDARHGVTALTISMLLLGAVLLALSAILSGTWLRSSTPRRRNFQSSEGLECEAATEAKGGA